MPKQVRHDTKGGFSAESNTPLSPLDRGECRLDQSQYEEPSFWLPAAIARVLGESTRDRVNSRLLADVGPLKRPVWAGRAIPLTSDASLQGYNPGYAEVYLQIAKYCNQAGRNDDAAAACMVSALLEPTRPLPFAWLSRHFAERFEQGAAKDDDDQQKAQEYAAIATALLEGRRPLQERTERGEGENKADKARAWLAVALQHLKLNQLGQAKKALLSALFGDPEPLKRESEPELLATGTEPEWEEIPSWTAVWLEEVAVGAKNKWGEKSRCCELIKAVQARLLQK